MMNISIQSSQYNSKKLELRYLLKTCVKEELLISFGISFIIKSANHHISKSSHQHICLIGQTCVCLLHVSKRPYSIDHCRIFAANKSHPVEARPAIYMGFRMEVTYLLRQPHFAFVSKRKNIYQAGAGEGHRRKVPKA